MAHQPANSGKSSKSTRNKKSQKLIIHRDKTLGLNKSALPHSIIEVVGTLNKAGFEAYIVGGGVRDSLLGLAPKDFDAVTSARPHEIKAIFGGRCRIIGRRFQLAHVYSGREMIEVATFRAPPKDDAHTTEEGMIIRDNVWGDINQDFARRDFSINALYYNPIKGEILDFCGAINDIHNRTLCLLGDAKTRIEEDPVRLLRALRFKAKLGFGFDQALGRQFNEENWMLLEQVSAHRLYDETQKMFSGGYLAPLLPILFEHGAMKHLMAYAPNEPTPLMAATAVNTDERVDMGKGANPAFFYAVLLWENYLYQLAKLKKKGVPFYEAQSKAAAKVVDVQRLKTAIPKFAEEFITSIWLMQPKLANPRVRDIVNLECHPKFRAAFDFLVLREAHDKYELSEPTNNMGVWWTQYQVADTDTRAHMVENLTNTGKSVGLPLRRRNRTSNTNDELLQLQQLSSRDEECGQKTPEPLFVVDNADEFLPGKLQKSVDKPTTHYREVVVPVFEQVYHSDAEFLKLLNNDEPYIPATRYRKRHPSSTLSIKEREQGKTKECVDSSKSVKKCEKVCKTRTKADRKVQSHADNFKPRRRKKSNAKPRAGESE